MHKLIWFNPPTAEFLNNLTGDQQQDSQLIGQFGVGFYSSFIVASEVEVITRITGDKKVRFAKTTGDVIDA